MAESKTPEYEPPQACVNRMIKSVLPSNVQITKDSRAAFARAAGIYIFYLTSCANDFSREKKRQTIFPADVLSSLKELDMGEYVDDVQAFLNDIKSKEGPSSKKSRPNPDGDDDDEVNKSRDGNTSSDIQAEAEDDEAEEEEDEQEEEDTGVAEEESDGVVEEEE